MSVIDFQSAVVRKSICDSLDHLSFPELIVLAGICARFAAKIEPTNDATLELSLTCAKFVSEIERITGINH